MHRTRKQTKDYGRYLANRSRRQNHPVGNCIFCEMDEADSNLIRETEYFRIIRNRFPYSIWDDQPVADHLMIVPITHTSDLSTLSEKAAIEYVRLIGDYEVAGYNIYARSTASASRSIAHQHTHLIKCAGPEMRTLFYFHKPYIRISF